MVLHHPLALLEGPRPRSGLARLEPAVKELADRHPARVGQAADPGIGAEAVEFVEDLLFCGAVDGPPLAPARLAVSEGDRADPLSIASVEDTSLAAPAALPLACLRLLLLVLPLLLRHVQFPFAVSFFFLWLIHPLTVATSDPSSLAIVAGFFPSAWSWRACS